MLVLVWLLIPTMMMRMTKSDEIITAHSGEAVLLTPDLCGGGLKRGMDIRWTHQHLVISLKSNKTTCDLGRCELLRNGSLRFSRVEAEDSGNYSLQVFDEKGKILKKCIFLLRVEADNSSSSSVVMSALMCCFLSLLLLLFITVFIFMRRRRRRNQRSGPLQENVYEVMHSHHGNKRTDEEKQEKEKESHYETPITQQMSGDIEDVYV